MNPYIKKIVELHKIHKAIEEKDCCNGGGNTPSGDITIDDVVKFIHNSIENVSPGVFPYTTWNDIPDYEDVNEMEVCKTNDDDKLFDTYILVIPSYYIGFKGIHID